MASVYSVRGSLAWMTASQGGSFVVQFGSSLIIARLLTPYDMGVFAFAVSIVGLLAIVRQLGLSGYIVRAKVADPAMLASVFTINALLALLLSLVVVALSVLGGALLNEPGVQRLLLVMAITPLISVFEFLPAAGIERQGDFQTIAVLSLIRGVVANIIMIVLAFSGFSYMSLAYGQVASTVIAAVGVNIIGWRYASLRVGFHDWAAVTRYGVQVLAISGANSVATRIGELVLARFLGLGALGLYSRASGLNGMLWDNVHLVVARVIFVDFAKQHRDGVSLRASYLRTLNMVTGLLWPAFAGLAVLAGPLVVLLFGQQWEGAAMPLSLLSIGSIILVSITMTYEVFVVCGELGRQTRLEFVRAFVDVVLFAAGSMVSLTGASAAKVLNAMFSFGLYRHHLERMTDTRSSDFMPIYRQGGALTFAAILPAVVVMSFYHWETDVPVAIVFCSVAAGVIIWIIALWALRHPVYDEGMRIVRSLNPRRPFTPVE